MSIAQRALVIVLIVAQFIALMALGWAAHKTATGAFLGAMIAGIGFELAQRWDRRLKGLQHGRIDRGGNRDRAPRARL